MEWSIFNYDNNFITTTREDINGVPLYTKNPGKLELIEYSRIDYKITTGMLEGAITWFKKQL